MTARSALPKPGALLGYRKDGRPIRLIAGGSQPVGDPAAPPANPGTSGDPATPPTPPAPPAPTPFDPNALSPEAKSWLESERKRIAAEEGACARTGSKEAARKELLAQLDIKADKPEDAVAELARERAERRQLQVNYSVERAASKAGADDELVAAYLAGKGRLKDLDPTASDFDTKVKALIDAALTEKPSLKLATATPPPTPPGGQGPGSGVVPGATPPPRARVADYVTAMQNHYKKPTQ